MLINLFPKRHWKISNFLLLSYPVTSNLKWNVNVKTHQNEHQSSLCSIFVLIALHFVEYLLLILCNSVQSSKIIVNHGLFCCKSFYIYISSANICLWDKGDGLRWCRVPGFGGTEALRGKWPLIVCGPDLPGSEASGHHWQIWKYKLISEYNYCE